MKKLKAVVLQNVLDVYISSVKNQDIETSSYKGRRLKCFSNRIIDGNIYYITLRFCCPEYNLSG